MIMKKLYIILLFMPLIGFAQLKAADNIANRHQPIGLKMLKGNFNKPVQARSAINGKPKTVESGFPKSLLGKYFIDSLYGYSFKSKSDSLLTRKEYDKYDANGLASTNYELDTITNKWIGSKSVITLGANGTFSLETDYSWDTITNNWINAYEYQPYFNANGKDTMDASSTWNPATSLWVINNKRVNKLNTDGNDTSEIGYEIDTTTNKWVADYKYENAFDANGNDTLSFYSEFNTMTNQWVVTAKYEYAYDANNNQILEIDSYLNPNTNQWAAESKYEYTYNSNGFQTSFLYYYWNSSQWVIANEDETIIGDNGFPILETYYNMNQITNQLALTEKDYSYVYNVTVGINSVKNGSVSYYPNPANSIVNLEISDNAVSQCQIYNSNGQLISTYLLKQGKNIINVSNLITGLYIIKIQTQKETITSKLIKQ